MSAQSDSMTPHESLDLIQRMIRQTKDRFAQVSFYFLLWGILLTLAGISEYVLFTIVESEYAWIGWPIAGIAGGLVAAIYNPNRQQDTYHFTDQMIGYLWGGFAVALVAVIVCSVLSRINPTPFVLLLTGLPTFVSGGVMRFRPLIIGGVVFWIIGIVSFFVPFGYTSLLFALAIITGYLIPGLMLRREEQQSSTK